MDIIEMSVDALIPCLQEKRMSGAKLDIGLKFGIAMNEWKIYTQKKKSGSRIHHKINWACCTPMIVNGKWRKTK